MFSKYIYSLYSFDLFPRRVGNPLQSVVNNMDEFEFYARANWGKRPIYTASNYYDDGVILFRNMVWDVDTDKGNSLEEAYRDLKALAEYFKHYNFLMTFSGQGFHFYNVFTPELLPIDWKLKYNMQRFQKDIVQKLGLTTVNTAVAEPKRMIRVPLTPYVYREGDRYIRLNRYAIPLSRESLDYSLNEILQFSEMSVAFTPVLSAKNMPIDPMIKEPDVEKQQQGAPAGRICVPFLKLDERQWKKWLDIILDDKLRKILLSTHSDHITNLLALSRVASFRVHGVGLDEESAVEFFNRVSQKWDNRDPVLQRKYVHYFYSRLK
ncbi:MAG: hypothetical protein ACP5US_10270 [Candidatus Kryptoniota bacterium]